MSPTSESSIPFDLKTWGQFLGQFGDARTHLLRAGGELILALKALLDSLLESLEREFPAGRQKWEFLYVMQYALGFLSARLPEEGHGELSQHQMQEQKVATLKSILAVIQAEIDEIGPSRAAKLSESAQIHLAAMTAIKNVLDREIEKAKAGDKPRGKKAAGTAAPRRRKTSPRPPAGNV